VRRGRALPRLDAAAAERAWRAFQISCPSLTGRADASGLTRPEDWRQLCAARPADFAGFFRTRFEPVEIGAGAAFATGYYEPEIRGCRTPQPGCDVPVYRKPPDLLEANPATGARGRGRIDETGNYVLYHDRAAIEEGALAGRGLELAWAADPVDLFFLQIQGSGQVRLSSGERLRIGYADQNGHPFRSLGRYLVERGEMTLDQASMQNIKAWAAANPHKLREALNVNPSYVFFRELKELKEDEGPIGAQNVPLSAGYSLAVDRRYIPLGAPIYLATNVPLSEERLERLMAAQDTGGAIRGVVRGDFYWGSGPEAGAQAGRMRNQARMWLLWPRGLPLPRDPLATCC
jgi:membrane-bound lytic murein transglycosylase A